MIRPNRLQVTTRSSLRFSNLFFVFALTLFSISLHPSLSADTVSKKSLLEKYEGVLALAEENKYSNANAPDFFAKIRQASHAILQENFEEADSLLDEVLADIKNNSSNLKVAALKEFRAQWLEIFLELFQKIALIALLAYCLTLIPRVRLDMIAGRLGWVSCLLLATAAILLGWLFALLDLSRYGASAWSFFDLQLILVVVAFLFGGWIPGLVTALAFFLFRWLLVPGIWVYPAVIAGAALTGFLGTRLCASLSQTKRISFGMGALAGLIHGLLIYGPLMPWMNYLNMIISIAFLMLVEGMGCWIFLAVISGVFEEEKRRQTENELLKTRLLFLQAQINPHFLFNALNTIAALCAREQALNSKRLIQKLSEFLRRIVRRVEDKVTVEEELASIDAYLELERARYGDRLQVIQELQLSPEALHIKIPLLILQPLVENAIRHGAMKRETKGVVRIQTFENGNEIVFRILDNGPGITPEKLSCILTGQAVSQEGAGIGILNIHERLKKIYGAQFGLKFEQSPMEGTMVEIRIPFGKLQKDLS